DHGSPRLLQAFGVLRGRMCCRQTCDADRRRGDDLGKPPQCEFHDDPPMEVCRRAVIAGTQFSTTASLRFWFFVGGALPVTSEANPRMPCAGISRSGTSAPAWRTRARRSFLNACDCALNDSLLDASNRLV